VTPYDLVLRSRQVCLPSGIGPAAVCVRDGRIVAVTSYSAVDGEDLGDLVLLPGLVDTHVHVNEPGRTEWEGFATATRAAAAGGVTTIIDMPLNSIPSTVSVSALDVKRQAAQGQCHVDVGFWGGAVPGNAATLPALYEDGVFGFKCFLVDSGVPEFPPLDPVGLEEALRAVDALFVVHAEVPGELRPAAASRRYADFLASRPEAAEEAAIELAISAARSTGSRVHILHLSAASAVPAIAAARADGVPITAETCPHYLVLTAEEVADGDTAYKCCPPIRGAANQDVLWAALQFGTVDCVVSDHSPSPAELKVPDFAAAWGGIASLQLGLSIVHTAAIERGYTLEDVVRWMAQHPADLVGLVHKGRIAVDADADLVAFDPDAQFIVDPAELHHRHPVTPYAGRRLRGAVRRTWLRGVPVDGTVPHGRLLRRGTRD
jgi:allantoinase